MKITVQINGKDVEIELTKEQVASIEAQNKPKKFEFKYTEDATFFIGHYGISTNHSGSCLDYIEHGRYRKSREAAQMSLARNKRANRLEALAEQLGGLKEWVKNEQNWYIYLSEDRTFSNVPLRTTFNPEIVYMTEKCAIEICRMLNEGEFEL